MAPTAPLPGPKPKPKPKPAVVVADPVEWPEPEPQRLDLPDPPTFDDDPHPGANPDSHPGANPDSDPELGVPTHARRAPARPVREGEDRDGGAGSDGGDEVGEWQGIRPLGRVERDEP
jgi:hypothetical protein